MPEIEVILDGTIYKGSDFTANGGYGYVDLFPGPIFTDMLTEIATRRAEMVAASGQAIVASSTTSLTIGTGVQNLTVEIDKGFTANQYVVVRADTSNYMIATVTSYDTATGALVVNVPTAHAIGSGTFASWTINLSGEPLPASGTGPVFVTSPEVPTLAPGDNSAKVANSAFVRGLAGATITTKTAAFTAMVDDCGKMFDCSGTFVLSLAAAATMGAKWFCEIKNSGAGTVTITPAGVETINGGATFALTPTCTARLQTDGVSWSILITATNPIELGSAIALPETASTVTMGDGSKYVKFGDMITIASEPAITSLSSLPLFSGTPLSAAVSGISVDTKVLRYANGIFMLAPLGATSAVLTSTDGVTWTSRNLGISASINQMRYLSDGAWYLCTSTAGQLLRSTDNGVTWSTLTVDGFSYGVNDIAFSGTRYAVAQASTNLGAISDDLITWTSTAVGYSNRYTIIYGAGLFVTDGSTSGTVRTSPDGITWTTRSNYNTSYYAGFWDGSQFVLYGSNRISTSPDGITWTSGFSPLYALAPSCVVYDGAYYYHAKNGVLYQGVDVLFTGAYSKSTDSVVNPTYSYKIASNGTVVVLAGTGGFVDVGPFSGPLIKAKYGAAATLGTLPLYARYV